jgi:hypothetical protein
LSIRTVLLGLAGSACVATLMAAPAGAADLCQSHPKDQWVKEDQIEAKAEGMGYQVRLVQPEDGCWEVKGTTKEGKRVEVYFDPATAEVVKTKGG